MKYPFKSLIQDFKKKDFLAGWIQNEEEIEETEDNEKGYSFGSRIIKIFKQKEVQTYCAGREWFYSTLLDKGLAPWQVNLAMYQAGASARSFVGLAWRLPASEVFENLEKMENLDFFNLEKADLENSDLKYANLEGANLRFANLRGANLEGANLSGADLTCANLNDANLKNTNLERTIFIEADLAYASLNFANARDTDFSGATLREADLRGIKINKAAFQNANLTRANVKGVDLSLGFFNEAIVNLK